MPERMAPEEGQGLVEYELVIFLVAVVVIAILALLGTPIAAVFSGITAAVQRGEPRCR